MGDTVLRVASHQIIAMSRATWEAQLSQIPEIGKTRLRFLSKEHHQVRNFVVRELPRTGQAIMPAYIAEHLALSREQVQSILADLEANLFFLVRNQQGAVSWAFPVAVETTPHHLTFHTGEQLYGA